MDHEVRDSRSTTDAAPGSRSRLLFPIVALAVVVVLGILLWRSGVQIREIDLKLRETEHRAEAVREKMAEYTLELEHALKRAENARVRATEAEQKADEQTMARLQAEFEKESLRTASEQAEAEARMAKAQTAEAQMQLDLMRKKRDAELNRMKDALSRIALTHRTPSGMVMELSDDSFRFEFDKADLSPENREILSRISGVLLASEGYRVFVYGHTDDVGTDQYNQGLSERRANAVSSYLKRAGIPEEIITVKGFGKTNPRVKGTTKAAREKNRRVEIGIVDTIIQYGQEVKHPNVVGSQP